MGPTAKTPRENRTITVDFQDESTYFQLLSDSKAFVEFVLAFILSLGFQLTHKSTCTGGSLTRHSHYARIRLGGLTIWRIQCTRCKSVFTVLPHFVLRYRTMRPDAARDALLATHGGLSLELCAAICHISPMALYRLVCAFGQHTLVSVLTRCGLPLPTYILADEKHSRCLTDRVYLPTIVSGRLIWHLGYCDSKSAVAFTESYGEFQQAALELASSYRVKGALTDGFDSTTKSMRTLFPGVRLGYCLRHALNKLPDKLPGLAAPLRQGLRSKFHTLLHRCRTRTRLRVVALGQRLRRFADHITATVGEDHGERMHNWFQDKKSGWYAVLEDPQMPAMSTPLDQAHNAFDRKLFMMKYFHHPNGSQAAFLTGLAHLYNLIPYQRRAKSAGQCGVEVEGGRVPTSDWMINLQILTSGGYRCGPEPMNH
jgi:transposase-like protein